MSVTPEPRPSPADDLEASSIAASLEAYEEIDPAVFAEAAAALPVFTEAVAALRPIMADPLAQRSLGLLARMQAAINAQGHVSTPAAAPAIAMPESDADRRTSAEAVAASAEQPIGAVGADAPDVPPVRQAKPGPGRQPRRILNLSAKDTAARLQRVAGMSKTMSTREIAAEFEVVESTIRRWLGWAKEDGYL